ncbi:MAG: ABC transporter substrate-binding protein, partial [Deltaproteobacteria bacterium]|nr:ABC transporter substrate-binding protein [Deltaproteobacteria bacterium]
ALMVAVGLAGGVGPEESHAGQPPSTPVTIGYASIGGAMAGVWVAKEAGLFAQEHLRADLVFMSGTLAMQALVSREVGFTLADGSMGVRARLSGADVALLATAVNSMIFSVVARPGVRRLDDLRGKRVAVSRLGAAADYNLRYVLKLHGIRPDRDVAILQFGSIPNNLAALEQGGVEAAVTSYPTTARAKRAGFVEVADFAALNVPFQHTGLWSSREQMRASPELVRAVLRAYVGGVRRFKAERELGMAALGKYTRLTDRVILEQTYDYYAPRFPDPPYPSLEGLKLVLEDLTASDPRAATARPAQFVELAPLQQVLREVPPR